MYRVAVSCFGESVCLGHNTGRNMSSLASSTTFLVRFPSISLSLSMYPFFCALLISLSLIMYFFRLSFSISLSLFPTRSYTPPACVPPPYIYIYILMECSAARSVSGRSGRYSGMRMSDTDFADYDSKVTFMFPGQGAQYMGMAAEICDEVKPFGALG